MAFKNREQAAFLLAKELETYRGQNPLVLAIPRGAVPMASIIAKELNGEMDVVLVHKLRAPNQPELAVGSVDEKGFVTLADYASQAGVTDSYLAQEKEAQLKTLKERRRQYTAAHPPIDPKDRVVIVVDDGVATGFTMMAALRSIRAKKPAKLIAAAAVAPHENLMKLKPLADQVVCLEVPPVFYAVGEFFEEFPQITDDEVISILKKSTS